MADSQVDENRSGVAGARRMIEKKGNPPVDLAELVSLTWGLQIRPSIQNVVTPTEEAALELEKLGIDPSLYQHDCYELAVD